MEKTLAVLNQMESDNIIGRYAIGGAIAATFYVEPIQTFDIDVFVIFPVAPSGLISAGPIYAYLDERGHKAEGETIIIEGWPVQFLPVFNSLTEEALNAARDVHYAQVPTRVLTAEHLAAIMLQTGRPKDFIRLTQFIELDILDVTEFEAILERHRLTKQWHDFRARFLK